MPRHSPEVLIAAFLLLYFVVSVVVPASTTILYPYPLAVCAPQRRVV